MAQLVEITNEDVGIIYQATLDFGGIYVAPFFLTWVGVAPSDPPPVVKHLTLVDFVDLAKGEDVEAPNGVTLRLNVPP